MKLQTLDVLETFSVQGQNYEWTFGLAKTIEHSSAIKISFLKPNPKVSSKETAIVMVSSYIQSTWFNWCKVKRFATYSTDAIKLMTAPIAVW